MIESGEAGDSTCGMVKFQAYCTGTGREQGERHTDSYYFGIGSAELNGAAIIDFPNGPFWLKFEVHIVDADIPLLWCLYNRERLGIHFKNLFNQSPIHEADWSRR